MRQIRRLRVVVLVSAGVFLAGFYRWKNGTPYQQPAWSPNHEYYLQKYSNSTFGMVGGRGSDNVSGYIRLYSKDGKLVHERYQTFLRDIDPVWVGDKVYLRGVGELDSAPWVLPSSAE